MQEDSMVNQGEMTKNKNLIIGADSEQDSEFIPDVIPSAQIVPASPNNTQQLPDEPMLVADSNSPQLEQDLSLIPRNQYCDRDQVKENSLEDDRKLAPSEEEYETYFCGSPSTSIITNEDEKAAESHPEVGSEDERESFHLRYSDIFYNWEYSDEERKWLRYKVEMLTRNQCVVFCILGHIVLSREEMLGVRHTAPTPEEARQALLCLCTGSEWDVLNLAILMAFTDKVNVVEKYISTVLMVNPYKARSLIKYMLLKML